METNEVLQQFSTAVDKLLTVQATQQNKRFEWAKVLVGLSPFLIGSAIGVIVTFTNLQNKIDTFGDTIKQLQTEVKNNLDQMKTDENNRAIKVDYNFDLIQRTHSDLRFIDTKNLN